MRNFLTRLCLSLVVLFAICYAASNQICYDKDGIEDPTRFPCDASADHSSCCEIGATCLSNGLCRPNSTLNGGLTKLYTSGCTDRSWDTDVCPQICNNNVTGYGVLGCGGGTYCCYDLNRADCCSTSSLVFNLGFATIVSDLTATPSAATTTSSLTSSFSPSVSAISQTTISSLTNHAPAAASATNSLSSSTPSNESEPPASKDTLAIGLGVGLGVAAALGISVAVAFLVRRRRRARSREMGAAGDGQVGDSPDIYDPFNNPDISTGELDGNNTQEMMTKENAHEIG